MSESGHITHLNWDPTQAGLQVHYPDGLETAQQNYQDAGLHPHTNPYAYHHVVPEDNAGKEAVYPDTVQVSGQPKGAVKPRRKLCILLGSIAAIVIILAIVLGTVLGSRAAGQDQSPAATSTPKNATNNTSNARLASTSGTWNGTGIALIETPFLTGAAQGLVAFQDYTGKINTMTWAQQGNDLVGISRAIPLGVDAANATAIAGVWTYDGPANASDYVLFYVGSDGILHDIWSNNTGGSSTEGVTAWTEGKLSSMGWKAPMNGSRISLTANWDQYCFGMSFGAGGRNSGGIRLWAGGVDGKVHQYSYDIPSKTWANQDYVFADLSAYGGIKRYTGNQENNCVNNTLFATDPLGEIVYVNQNMNNETNWPVGGAWGNTVRSGKHTASPDSSIAEGKQLPSTGQDYVYYPGDSGKLYGQSVDSNPGDLFTNGNSQIWNVDVMSGTEFGEYLNGQQTLLVFQSNGSSLDWAVVSSPSDVQSGNLFHG